MNPFHFCSPHVLRWQLVLQKAEPVGSSQLYESLIQEVCALDRASLVDQLLNPPDNISLDFSRPYLDTCDIDRLRHLLLAALWRSRMKQHAHT